MGSLEDLFEREEIAWNSYDDIKYVLSRHNKNSLTGPQDNLAVQLGEPYRLKNDIERTNILSELDGLKREVDGLDISKARGQLTREVDNKILRIEREEVRRQELEIAKMTEIREREKQQREIRKAEMELARRIAREEERVISQDKRKRKNAQRTLKKLRKEQNV